MKFQSILAIASLSTLAVACGQTQNDNSISKAAALSIKIAGASSLMAAAADEPTNSDGVFNLKITNMHIAKCANHNYFVFLAKPNMEGQFVGNITLDGIMSRDEDAKIEATPFQAKPTTQAITMEFLSDCGPKTKEVFANLITQPDGSTYTFALDVTATKFSEETELYLTGLTFSSNGFTLAE